MLRAVARPCLARARCSPGATRPSSRAPKGRDPRVLVVVLRGALDGLAVVAPVGDPDWVKLRGDKALVVDGKVPALPLDSFFALNPAMPNLYRLYQAHQATIVHASATPYRERSHFDGQDMLESGFTKPGSSTAGGSIGRSRSSPPMDGCSRRAAAPLRLAPLTPLVVRGPAPVMSWVPQQLLPASDDTHMRVLDLYRHTDPKLGARARRKSGSGHVDARAAAMEPSSRSTTGPRPWDGARTRLRHPGREHRGQIPGTARRSTCRRVGRRRLGYAHQRRRRIAVRSPICWAYSMAPSRPSKKAWARPGTRPSSC